MCYGTPNLTALTVDVLWDTKSHSTDSRCVTGHQISQHWEWVCYRTPNLTALTVDVLEDTKSHSTDSRCVTGHGEYTVCRHVRAYFNSEILQALAVKGLKDEVLNDLPWKGEKGSSGASRTILDLNVLKATLGKAFPPPRRGGAHMGFSERKDTTLNRAWLLFSISQ